MQVWQLAKLVDTMMQMKNRDRTGIHNMMTYIVIPYVSSMGYDVYNLDTSDISLDEGKITVKLDDTLSLVVSLTSIEPDEENERMFIHIDELQPSITLSFKVLGVWEQVVSVSLSDKTATSNEKYTEITKYVKKDRLIQEYRQKGERFLTEGVVNRQLDEGRWDNEFLLNVLVDELKNPSDGLIEVLANRLGEKYTTRDPKVIKEKLEPIAEVGLKEVVNRIVNDGKLYNDEDSYSSYGYADTVVQKDHRTVEDNMKDDNSLELYKGESGYDRSIESDEGSSIDSDTPDLTEIIQLQEIPN